MEEQASITPIDDLSSTSRVENAGTSAAEGRSHLWIVLALLTLYLVWGSTYFFIRVAIVSIPPFLMTGARLLVAGGVLYFILRMQGYAAPTRAEWGGSARMSLFLIGGGMGGVAFAEQWVASSVTAFCIATTPLWISIFSGLWGRWPRRAEWIGLVVALLVGERPTGKLTPSSVFALLYLITFGSLLAYSAYIYVLRRVRPALATSYAYINPLVAVCLGIIFAGERTTPLGIAGMAVIIMGVVLVSLARERKPKRAIS